MSVLDNFGEWKEFLGNRVKQAEGIGMSEETISDLAYQIGDYLNEGIDPRNHQQRVLKELWDVADSDEQHMIASLMVKLVKSETEH
ncbi:Protein of unknown function [Seinonella peptonophila]|uniref:DUF3243 domain-containing protein n=1 Tax=Seinonella peptonophila TaxID=112248 RepID=A0A1M4TBB3_9BACL|nr:DUF3243 domain-containing protein [Seinonella peptonophila]SHE41733.1 Protein of unknown function [Seinonella peptonophila]